MKKKLHALLTAAVICVTAAFGGGIPSSSDKASPLLTANAASADYPMQLMNIAAKDNSAVLTEDATVDCSPLSVKPLGKNLAGSWRFDRVNTDSRGTFFKLVNAQSGRMLTPYNYDVSNGTSVVMYGAESHETQHWYVIPVKNDRLGNGLYYKIVNYSDTSLALTQSSDGMKLSTYTGADEQLWLLNSDGLQGFAGYCKNDNTGNIKASDIGGLFGEVVEASSFDQLKSYAESETPYTIVVTKNIGVSSFKQDSQNHLYCPDGRIYVRSNKTIIGSYGAHTLNNVQFCTASNKGVGNNVVIKNFDMQHDAKSNGNDSIVVYFASGENLWVDHVTFTGHSGYNTLGDSTPDYDKFIACCYDADYCTVSDSYFGLHEYGLILGYPDDSDSSYQNKNNFPRMTIAGCKFKDTLTRAPGLMRYGYFHSLNNYVYNFNMAYTVCSDCKLFAESCYYDGASTKGNVVCDWDKVNHPGSFADSNSKGVNCKRLSPEGLAQYCSWRPSSNYSYSALSAYSAMTYCDSYSGCQSTSSNMMYLTYGEKGVPSAGFYAAVDEPFRPGVNAVIFSNGTYVRFRNAYYDDFYLTVNENEFAELDNASEEPRTQIFGLIQKDNYWYCIESTLYDNDARVLDVNGKKTEYGTHIGICRENQDDNQQFMFIENKDGTYKILTKISEGVSAISADTGSSAVVQMTVSDDARQNWILEVTTQPGVKMDTDALYEFRNMNSGLVMDIANGEMSGGTNVQQWESNGFDCQRWKLIKAEKYSEEYSIVSAADESYALTAEGTGNGANLSIQKYSPDNENQHFEFYMNFGGLSYYIRPAGHETYVEVAAASMNSGANVQIWENTDSSCQKWAAETVTTATTTTTTTETTTTTTTATEPPVQINYGDANCDGEVNLADAVLIMQSLANPVNYPLTEQGKLNADVNGGGVTTKDAHDIQRFMLGILSSLPC